MRNHHTTRFSEKKPLHDKITLKKKDKENKNTIMTSRWANPFTNLPKDMFYLM